MIPRASTCRSGKRRNYHSVKKITIYTNNCLNADLINLEILKTPVKRSIEKAITINNRPMTAPRSYRSKPLVMFSTKPYLITTPSVSKMPLKPILFNPKVFSTGIMTTAAKAKRGIQIMLSNKKAYINRVENMYESKRSQSVTTIDRMKYGTMPVNGLEIQGSHMLLKKHRIGN